MTTHQIIRTNFTNAKALAGAGFVDADLDMAISLQEAKLYGYRFPDGDMPAGFADVPELAAAWREGVTDACAEAEEEALSC